MNTPDPEVLRALGFLPAEGEDSYRWPTTPTKPVTLAVEATLTGMEMNLETGVIGTFQVRLSSKTVVAGSKVYDNRPIGRVVYEHEYPVQVIEVPFDQLRLLPVREGDSTVLDRLMKAVEDKQFNERISLVSLRKIVKGLRDE